jgi:hypothetical protein
MMVPLLLLSPPLFGGKDNARSTHADSSTTALVHAVCWALKAHASSDRPLLASLAGGKVGKGNGSKNDGDAGGRGQELDHAPDQDGPPLPPLAMAQWQ